MRRLLTLRKSGGFTLVELIITIAMVAILASLAVPSYRAFVINQQLTAASGDFMVSLLQARSEAIRLGKNVSVAPLNGSDWRSGWNIFQDNDCSGTYTASNSGTNTLVVSSPAMGDNVSIVTGTGKTSGSFSLSTPYLSYAPSGFLRPYSCAYASSQGNGKLWLTTAETGRNRVVIVSLAGRVRVCAPSTTDDCTGSS